MLLLCGWVAAQRVSAPTEVRMLRVARIVKYLWATRDHGIFIKSGEGTRDLVVDCDADWPAIDGTGEARVLWSQQAG